MKSIRDIAHATVREATPPVSYEGTLYVQHGGDGYTAVDARRRLILLDAAMRYSGWRTIRGVHVHVGEGGKIDKGPAALVGKSHAEAHEHVKSKGHDRDDKHVRAEKAIKAHTEGRPAHEAGMSADKARKQLGTDHPLVQQHEKFKSEQTSGSNRETHGWKLHVGADPQHHDAVEQHIKKLGIPYKRGRSGGQEGKDFTIYVGHRDSAAAAAESINRNVGHLLNDPTDNVKVDDAPMAGKVYGRFDIGKKDQRFHQYGNKGVPFTMDDMHAATFDRSNFNSAAAKDKAHRMLVSSYGEFYAGSAAGSKALTGAGGAFNVPANSTTTNTPAGERSTTIATQMPLRKDQQQYVGDVTREDSLNRYRIARGLGLDVAKPQHGSEMGYLDDADQKAFEHHLDSEYEEKHGAIDENDHHTLAGAGHKLDYGHDDNDIIGPLVHRATTEAVNDATHRVIFRTSIERRLMEHHAERGGESDDFDVDGEHAGEYASINSERNRTFHGSLPGEVRNFLQGRYHLRRLFKTTSNPSAAGGDDALGELGSDRYLSAVERMGRGKLGRAIDFGKTSDDPEIRFLAHIRSNAAPTPRGEKRTQLLHLPADKLEAGHSFTINGDHFHVHEPEEGERVLLGPSHYPELPLDAATHVPIDRGSLRRRKRTTTPTHGDDFAPFSRIDVRASLITLSAPGRSASGNSNGVRCRLAALSRALTILEAAPPARS